jgi:hypothetical protein
LALNTQHHAFKLLPNIVRITLKFPCTFLVIGALAALSPAGALASVKYCFRVVKCRDPVKSNANDAGVFDETAGRAILEVWQPSRANSEE